MYCSNYIFIFAIGIIDAHHIKDDIVEYFCSESVHYFRREWGLHRKAIEYAIANTLQETIGKDALNVLILKKSDLKLAEAFYHSHGLVNIVLNNLQLAELPQCWLPEVSFSLAANIFKLETKLTKMVINAAYMLLRNKSDIITNKTEQDVSRISPFLFQQVQNVGKLTLSVDNCILSGYVLTRLSGRSISLGHHRFSLTKCDYFVEIYQPGSSAPPVMAPFSAKVLGNGVKIKHLVLKPLQEEFLAKIQSAIFSFVNTTAIFGQNLTALKEDQTIIHRKAESSLKSMVRELNKRIAMMSDGAVTLEDYFVSFDDFTPYNRRNFTLVENKSIGVLKLNKIVLTGLDTAYISNRGGPYTLDHVIVGEQIRFSSLQVRGNINTILNEVHTLSVSISDLAVNIDAHINSEEPLQVEVVGFRKLDFSEPRVQFKPAEGIIIGYLMNKIPKVIYKIIKLDLNKDIQEQDFPVLQEISTEEEYPEYSNEDLALKKDSLGFS